MRFRNYPTEDKLVTIFIFLVVFMFIASTGIKFFGNSSLYTLSEGTMRATSAKLSKKGWIWKTYDGWIPIGVNSEGGLKRWKFSVKNSNPEVINCIENNDKVKLYYTDEVLLPFKYGNSHQVYKCEIIK